MKKGRILILMGRYLPGYKDGGPVRSIKNLTDYLGNEYEFQILTCDRDHGDLVAYPNIEVNQWNKIGKARVYYVPPKGFTFRTIEKLCKQADLLYVCGCFNDYAINALLLKRLGKIKIPVVVAAMGLFSPMEFRLKYRKKKLFVLTFNYLGMFKNIYWSATSKMEVSEISQQVNAKPEQFFIAEDLPRMVDNARIEKRKKVGFLEVVWISRIARKKNLLEAIEILKHAEGNIKFTIYGSIFCEDYWQECKNALDQLPSNITWEYKGSVDSEKVVQVLQKYHVFLFPTFGENYGHVIQEALSAGCACILSDQTPWKHLEEYGVGYTLDLKNRDSFVEAINSYVVIDQEQMQIIADKALQYAIDHSNEKVRNTGYRTMFDSILQD